MITKQKNAGKNGNSLSKSKHVVPMTANSTWPSNGGHYAVKCWQFLFSEIP